MAENEGASMRYSAIGQSIGCVVAVFLLSLGTGNAAGESRSDCANPRSARTPTTQAAKQSPTPIAFETPVWKTITIGGSKGVNAVRAAIDAAPCPMWIGDEADEILGRPAFPFVKAPVELDLVVLSVFELGFGDRASRNDIELAASVEVSLHDIYTRAVALGFELCPAEVGPALRLNYLDQPLGEFLHIAMKPVARYSGELVDFTVGNGGAGLMLVGGNGDPDVKLPGAARFVFVRPRGDSFVSGPNPTGGVGDIAKR
jgi:hypothetical protein